MILAFVITYHEKIEELSVPRINRLEKTYLLNTCLFRRTEQKEYQTTQISKMHYVDDQGKVLPYHKK